MQNIGMLNNYGLYWFCVEIDRFVDVDRLTFKHKLLTILDRGWGNGYVLLPPEHPFFYNYDIEEYVHVHGGITYNEFYKPEYYKDILNNNKIIGNLNLDNYNKFSGYRIVGFDTSHFGDTLQTCTYNFVMNETQYLLDQCLNDTYPILKKYKEEYLLKERFKKLSKINNLSEK